MGEMLRERIARKTVVTSTGCWEWTGTRTKGGYGLIRLGSRTDGTRRTALVHRVAYEEHVGPIPEGLTLDHLCRNRACANPAHCEPVTMRENTMRGDTVSAVNAAKEHCPNCGGQYALNSEGRRVCPPCRRSYNTDYKRRKRVSA